MKATKRIRLPKMANEQTNKEEMAKRMVLEFTPLIFSLSLFLALCLYLCSILRKCSELSRAPPQCTVWNFSMIFCFDAKHSTFKAFVAKIIFYLRQLTFRTSKLILHVKKTKKRSVLISQMSIDPSTISVLRQMS